LFILFTTQGAGHKRRTQSGWWICPDRTFSWQGDSDAHVKTVCCKKNFGFRKLWCVRMDKWVEAVWTFCEQG